MAEFAPKGPNINQNRRGGEGTLRGPDIRVPGTAAPASPAPERNPQTQPKDHRARNIALTVGGGVVAVGTVIGAWLGLRGGDGSSTPNPDSTAPVGIPGTVAPDFKTNTPPPATVTVEAPTPTPESKHMNYEIAHENVYDGFSLAVPVEMTKPTDGMLDGQPINYPGMGELYADESFNDENGTVGQKINQAKYTLLHQGYIISNPDSGVTLEQFIKDAEEGKKNGSEPKYNFTRKGTGQEEITFNEQTFLQFMALPKNLNTYAQPFQDYAFASEAVGDNKVRIGIWAENKGALAQEFGAERKDYEMTNWIVSSMTILIVHPDMYTVQGNLDPEKTSKLAPTSKLVESILYKDPASLAPQGAIKAKESPFQQ